MGAIYIQDQGVKVQFSLEEPKGRVVVNQECDLDAFRQALVDAGKVSDNHKYMLPVWDKQGRLRIKTQNRFAKQLRQIAKATSVVSIPKGKKGKKQAVKKQVPCNTKKQAAKNAVVAGDVDPIISAMIEAERENERRDRAVKRQISDRRRSMLEKELSKYGMKMVEA